MFIVRSTDCSVKIPSASYSNAINLASSLSSSIQSFYEEEDDGTVEKQSDLKHSSGIKLNAKKYKKASFIKKVHQLLCDDLSVEGWAENEIDVSSIKIEKITGALTNSILFVSANNAPTVLLRVYGPSSTLLISRPRELHILNTLSKHYNLGPKIYGTFANGRVEEWFSSRPFSKDDIRSDLKINIAKRMRELHSVDLRKLNVGPVAPSSLEVFPDRMNYGVWENIASWLTPASVVLKRLSKLNLPPCHPYFDLVDYINLPVFIDELNSYQNFIKNYEVDNGPSPFVFCHNDTQPGNILLLKEKPIDRPSHHQICVIDFEYASPNARGYDIANHFTEWRYDYHHRTHSWAPILEYPDENDRKQFYEAYFNENEKSEGWFERIENERLLWSPASLAMWGIWGIVQSRDQVKFLCDKFNNSQKSTNENLSSSQADFVVNLEERTSSIILDDDSSSDDDNPTQSSKQTNAGDFEYLLYAKAKIQCFRDEFYKLKNQKN